MLAFLIPREGPYEIVAEAATGSQAMDRWREFKPDLVVVDLLLPGMSGVELVRRLRSEAKDLRMLVYSGTASKDLIAEAMLEHPDGFVHKEDTLDVLREALRAVAAGSAYFTPMAKDSVRNATSQRLSKLTNRERSIVQFVAEGCGNKEIAARLSLSIKTVEGHRASIAEKLDIHDVATLTRFAIRQGMVSIE